MRLQGAPGLLLGPVSHRPRRALQGWGRDTCSVNTQEMMPSVSHTYPGPPYTNPNRVHGSHVHGIRRHTAVPQFDSASTTRILDDRIAIHRRLPLCLPEPVQ